MAASMIYCKTKAFLKLADHSVSKGVLKPQRLCAYSVNSGRDILHSFFHILKLYSTLWNVPQVTCIFSGVITHKPFKGECVHQENTSDKWGIHGIPQKSIAKLFYYKIPCHGKNVC